MTAKVIYEGNLHTTATHIRSGSVIETDAPVDNGGNGAAFSPTDLVATALASCMCTLMGISANARGIELGNIDCEVEKIMVANPRRIGEIKVKVVIQRPDKFSDGERRILEHAALTCPVFESLHPECIKTILFEWP